MPYAPDEVIFGGGGKRLSHCTTENGTYLPVYGTQEVSLPERELGEAEITNDDSPLFHGEFIPGRYDSGSAPFTYVYTDSQFEVLEEIFQLASDAETRVEAIIWWKIALSDGRTAKFRGFLKKHDLPIEMDEAPIVEAEIRATGPIAWSGTGGS